MMRNKSKKNGSTRRGEGAKRFSWVGRLARCPYSFLPLFQMNEGRDNGTGETPDPRSILRAFAPSCGLLILLTGTSFGFDLGKSVGPAAWVEDMAPEKDKEPEYREYY